VLIVVPGRDGFRRAGRACRRAYVLSSLHAALYAMFAVIALQPFANFPFSVGLTPTLLDGALGAFLLVYALQWMSGQRRLLRSTPLTPVVLAFVGIMLFAFLMGLRHAPLTARVLRNVLEMVLSLLLIPVLIDVMRDAGALRRAVAVLILLGGLAALVGIALWLLPTDPEAISTGWGGSATRSAA